MVAITNTFLTLFGWFLFMVLAFLLLGSLWMLYDDWVNRAK